MGECFGSFQVRDFEIEVAIMKNKLCSVLRSIDQDRLQPGLEYEELRGL